MLLGSLGWRPGRLLSILQRTSKNLLVYHGCSAMAEDSLEGSSVTLLSEGAGSYLGMEVV